MKTVTWASIVIAAAAGAAATIITPDASAATDPPSAADAALFDRLDTNHDGQVVGVTSSGGFGHTIGKPILFGYVPADKAGYDLYEVEVFGKRYPARRQAKVPYDWGWKRSVPPLSLGEGYHILKLKNREDGTRVDKLLLSRGSTPAGPGTAGARTSCP